MQDIDTLFRKTKGRLFFQRGAGFLGRIIPENPGIPIIWVCVENLGKKVPYGRLVLIDD